MWGSPCCDIDKTELVVEAASAGLSGHVLTAVIDDDDGEATAAAPWLVPMITQPAITAGQAMCDRESTCGRGLSWPNA